METGTTTKYFKMSANFGQRIKVDNNICYTCIYWSYSPVFDMSQLPYLHLILSQPVSSELHVATSVPILQWPQGLQFLCPNQHIQYFHYYHDLKHKNVEQQETAVSNLN